MADILVFTRTAGYRHASIPAGIAALRRLADGDADPTEDPEVFRPPTLARYAVIVFLSTSGDVLDEAGRDALAGYLAGGGAWLGIHAASTTEYGWPWFGGLAGARFAGHPPVQPATILVRGGSHPATRHLGPTWVRSDEWYSFRDGPPPDAKILLGVDESTYTGGTMGADHPLAWCREYAGGRSFYTALGHTVESFIEEPFLRHLRGALDWLTG